MSLRGCLLKYGTDSTAQNLTTGPVGTFATEIYDTDNFHNTVTSTSRITIPSAVNNQYGIFTATLSLDAFTPGGMNIGMFKNGADTFLGNVFARNACQNGQAASTTWLNVSTGPVLLATNDFYEIQYFSNGDASVTIKAETNFGLVVLDNYSAAQCLVKLSADQTAANYSTPSVISWGASVYDSNSFHDNVTNNSRITIPPALNNKYVQLRASVVVGSMSGGSAAAIAIRKNGSLLTYDGMGGNANGKPSLSSFAQIGTQVCTQVIQVVTGDYFEVLYYNADNSVDLDSTKCNFGLICVGT